MTFIEYTDVMFQELAKVAPRSLLEYNFRNYVPDWIKYRRHLNVLACCMSNTPHPNTGHFLECDDLWYAIAESLGLEDDIKESKILVIGCGYARCANPYLPGGAQFSCATCVGISYCSTRCQAL